jgi:hypothetical protein
LRSCCKPRGQRNLNCVQEFDDVAVDLRPLPVAPWPPPAPSPCSPPPPPPRPCWPPALCLLLSLRPMTQTTEGSRSRQHFNNFASSDTNLQNQRSETTGAPWFLVWWVSNIIIIIWGGVPYDMSEGPFRRHLGSPPFGSTEVVATWPCQAHRGSCCWDHPCSRSPSPSPPQERLPLPSQSISMNSFSSLWSPARSPMWPMRMPSACLIPGPLQSSRKLSGNLPLGHRRSTALTSRSN